MSNLMFIEGDLQSRFSGQTNLTVAFIQSTGLAVPLEEISCVYLDHIQSSVIVQLWAVGPVSTHVFFSIQNQRHILQIGDLHNLF